MNLLFVVEGHSGIGYGHFIRCLALAQIARDQSHDLNFIGHYSSGLKRRLKRESLAGATKFRELRFDREDANYIAEYASHLNSDLIILDDYRIDTKFLSRLDEISSIKKFFIDDEAHLDFYHCEYILNHNPYANASMYPPSIKKENCEVMAGRQYTLLRKIFKKWSNYSPGVAPRAQNILITLGGTDVNNATGRILNKLPEQRAMLNFRVVTGESNPNLKELKDIISKRTRTELIVDSERMDEEMHWADLAIASGGSTNWELCYMGVPTINVTVSENQKKVVNYLREKDLSISIGHLEDFESSGFRSTFECMVSNHQLRKKMSRKRRNLLDLKGPIRILNNVESSSK